MFKRHPIFALSMIVLLFLLALNHSQVATAGSGGRASPSPAIFDRFSTLLEAEVWQKHILGRSSLEGGYVVDISPKKGLVDGAYVEHKILPEFDGARWNDVLWMRQPVPAGPLRVDVTVFSTRGWTTVYQATHLFNPADWQGYNVQSAGAPGGFVVEVNPTQPGAPGDTFERVTVQPEYFAWVSDWHDVLRAMIPAGQQPTEAEITIYRVPETLTVQADYTLHLAPEDWRGTILGLSRERAGYLIDVSPLTPVDGYVGAFTVQPEFDGRRWNDAARVMTPAGMPEIDLRVIVYRVTAKD